MLRNGSKCIPARVALDGCSTDSIFTEAIADALKLDKEPMIKTVAGAVKNGKTTHSSSVTVSTVIPSAMAQDIDIALVQTLPTVTPPGNVKHIKALELLKDKKLADPELGGKLDGIIGAPELPYFWAVGGHQFCTLERLTVIDTCFGWSVSGWSADSSSENDTATLNSEIKNDQDIDDMFHKLYELEKVPQASLLTEDENYAVKQFEDSIKQHPDGRYSCALPRVKSPPPIGESKQMAISRFFFKTRRK